MLSKLPDPHPYFANGIPTRRGGPEGCARCPLPKAHPVHIDPPANPIAEQESRKLGEPVGQEACTPPSQDRN